MNNLYKVVTFLFLIFILVRPVNAETIVLQPSIDSSNYTGSIYNGAPDTHYGTTDNWGMGYNGGYDVFIKWDLSSLDVENISSAVFSFYVSDTYTNATWSIGRSLKSANVNEVTWNSYSTGNSWDTAGADGANDVVEMGSLSSTTDDSYNDVELDLDEFETLVSENGVIMFERTGGTSYTLVDRMGQTNPPKITITYSTVTPTPTSAPTPTPVPDNSGSWCTYDLVTATPSAGFIAPFPSPENYTTEQRSDVLLDYYVTTGFEKITYEQNIPFPSGLYPYSNGSWEYTATGAYTVTQDFGVEMSGDTSTYYQYGNHDWFGMSLFGIGEQKPTSVSVYFTMYDGSRMNCTDISPVQETCTAFDIGCWLHYWVTNIKHWFYTLFIPSTSEESIEAMVDIAKTKSPWGYLYAFQSMSLVDPDYENTDVPDFTLPALSIKVDNGSSVSALQLTPEVTIPASTWDGFASAITAIRTAFGVLIIAVWAFGLAYLIMEGMK